MPKVGRTTSTSKRLKVLATHSTPHGRTETSRVMGPKAIQKSVAEYRAKQTMSAPPIPLSDMDIPDADQDEDTDFNNDPTVDDLEDVLQGRTLLSLSHIGGEFQDILSGCLQDEASRRKPKDSRTRRDRTQTRNDGFALQMDGMVNAYMEWEHRMGNDALEKKPESMNNVQVEASMKLTVMDVFQSFSMSFSISTTDANIPAALLRQGCVPTAPLQHHLVFSIRTLELYRITHLRSPHLTIEPFVKSLCDMHRVPFRSYLSQQFTIAFDLYLEIRRQVAMRVDTALGRDVPQWRLKNACSACTYKLEDEDDLVFRMLVTMDGNDSLKRLRGAKVNAPVDEDTAPSVGPLNARKDSRRVHGDRYLTREEVDRWAKANLEEILSSELSKEEMEENPCAGRWTNMINEVTAKMWGIFDETGVFLALCRHGFTLVIADMIQSGELSKYPLAVVNVLMKVFGEGIGAGYDIGCKFRTTVDTSALGQMARELRFKTLVGSFHGHAHNRICQLSNLATYVRGMGLEDLEGCERFFSKSNALAASVRHASTFHRQQKINEYMAHTDAFETEHALSNFLINNYNQALQLLKGKAALEKTMADQGITNTDVFHRWLEEERTYLTSLAHEPIQETREMDYYQKLVNFHAASATVNHLRNNWHTCDSQAPKPSKGKRQKNPETQLRHAQENADRALIAVQTLEEELDLSVRWTPESPQWQSAAVMVTRRRYQRCLDELEGLVVSRMFELTKMNMSQTGYKLRKHIAKALKARSQAIKNALERYNAAAAQLSPPRAALDWNEVVEYAFLADFDLLRDCRQDVRKQDWARPASRLAMNQYFKMERAQEEIQRLNIEIRRVVTHMQDEEAFLLRKRQDFEVADPIIAFQIHRYSEQRTRFYNIHRRRFRKLAANPSFSGTIQPGVALDNTLLVPPQMALDIDEPAPSTSIVDETQPKPADVEDLPSDDDEEDDVEKEISDAMANVFIHA